MEVIELIGMNEMYAREIAEWKYEGVYSFYNHNGSIDGFMDVTHYACINKNNKLIGYFCFGTDGQIPTVEDNVYKPGYIDIGLGLRPDLCGKGFGTAFIKTGLDFAKNKLHEKKIRISVAVFNERATKCYLKAGFAIENEVTNSYFKNKFYIMTKDL